MKRFWPFAIAAVVVAFITIGAGVYELTRGIPVELHETGLRIMAGYIPILLAFVLLALPVLAYRDNHKRQFTFRPDGLLYENGDQNMPIRWRNVTLLRPQRMKGTWLVATVSDGKQFARIEMFFFPQFSEIIDEIDYQRRAARSEHSV